MTQVINTNIASLNAQLNLQKSQGSLQTSLARLSSGMRINSAKDDAAGLSISDRMSSQITGLDQAVRNANDAISLSQTAEGALNTVDQNLQRIRQLALQSANSTNSSSDRAALDQEAQSLITEIQRVAGTTQFNGINLLDGTFNSSQFQVGANANQTISVSIGAATTSTLGSWGGQAATAVTTNSWTAASTISINSTVIGASIDQSATVKGWLSDSAAAKSAAINAQTAITGVTSTANTTVAGAAPIGSQALGNGDLTINGISIGPVAAAGTAAAQGANSAAAINLMTSSTGVTASANASSGALTLTAADGRDIILGSNTGTPAATTKVFNATGLTATTGAAGTAGAQTFSLIGSGATGDTILIAGVTFTFDHAVAEGTNTVVDATHVTVGSTGETSSVSVAANFITAFNNTKTNALLAPTLGSITATNPATNVITLTDSRHGTAAALGTTLANASAISNFSGTGGTLDGAYAATTNYGKLTLTSASTFTLADSGTAGGLTAAGLGAYSATQTLLNTLSIATVSGSNTAITTLDAALQQVNTLRANLGATQNRFASTVSNLQTTSQNISAARSRIQDTDFASETANLTRSQILQQAGVAMLSQANALPNLVLSLLK